MKKNTKKEKVGSSYKYINGLKLNKVFHIIHNLKYANIKLILGYYNLKYANVNLYYILHIRLTNIREFYVIFN